MQIQQNVSIQSSIENESIDTYLEKLGEELGTEFSIISQEEYNRRTEGKQVKAPAPALTKIYVADVGVLSNGNTGFITVERGWSSSSFLWFNGILADCIKSEIIWDSRGYGVGHIYTWDTDSRERFGNVKYQATNSRAPFNTLYWSGRVVPSI